MHYFMPRQLVAQPAKRRYLLSAPESKLRQCASRRLAGRMAKDYTDASLDQIVDSSTGHPIEDVEAGSVEMHNL